MKQLDATINYVRDLQPVSLETDKKAGCNTSIALAGYLWAYEWNLRTAQEAAIWAGAPDADAQPQGKTHNWFCVVAEVLQAVRFTFKPTIRGNSTRPTTVRKHIKTGTLLMSLIGKLSYIVMCTLILYLLNVLLHQSRHNFLNFISHVVIVDII